MLIMDTYIQFSGELDRLHPLTAEHWERPLLGPRMLLEAQAEHFGRQVNVPVSSVRLYQLAHHPV